MTLALLGAGPGIEEVVGGGGITGPTNALNTSAGSLTGTNTKTFTTTSDIPAGAAVVISLLLHGDKPSSFSDSTGQTWTAETARQSSTLGVFLYKCIASSAMPAGTTITFNWSFTNQTSGAISVDWFTGFSSLPGTSNGGNGGTGTQQTITVTGPTAATSYQLAVVGFSVTGGANGPDSGSTASWTYLRTVASADYIMKMYYQACTSTSNTTLKSTPGSFCLYAYAYLELAV